MNPASGTPTDEETPAWARLYRVVHGWPMLAGLPVPLFLLLMVCGIFGAFGARLMGGGLTLVAIVVGVVGGLWLGLSWLMRQDQVSVPLFFVRRRTALRSVISSYSPSWTRMGLDEEG